MLMKLFTIKEKLKEIYGKYDRFIIPAGRFIFALITFLVINSSLGFMAKLKSPFVSVLLALICAFMPSGALVLFSALLILAHIFALSIELAIVVFIVFFVLLAIYFRFAPSQGYMSVVTTVLFALRMPYVAPFVAGLTMNVFSFIPVVIGIFTYYLMKFASKYDKKIDEMTTTNIMDNVNYILNGLFNNKGMLVFCLVFSVTIIIVYAIRKLSIDYAWIIACGVGAGTNLILMIVGKIALGSNISILGAFFGNILALIVSFFLYLLVFSGDYSRTEVVSFEDDDYYYYVKAVPKISVSAKDVKVKKINAQKTRRTTHEVAQNEDREPTDYDEYIKEYKDTEPDESDKSDFIEI